MVSLLILNGSSSYGAEVIPLLRCPSAAWILNPSLPISEIAVGVRFRAKSLAILPAVDTAVVPFSQTRMIFPVPPFSADATVVHKARFG